MPSTPTRLSRVEAFKRGALPEEPVELHNIVAHTEELHNDDYTALETAVRLGAHGFHVVTSALTPRGEFLRVQHGDHLTVSVQEHATSTDTNGTRYYRVIVGDVLELPRITAKLESSQHTKEPTFTLSMQSGWPPYTRLCLGREFFDTVKAAIWELFRKGEARAREERENILERVSTEVGGGLVIVGGEHGHH